MKKIIHISIGLDFDNGGAAHFGRLISHATYEYCKDNKFEFEVLNLGKTAPINNNIRVQNFHGQQLKLTILALTKQIFSRDTYILFDHIGPMQIQGVLPYLTLPSLVFFLGKEVWRPLNTLQKRALLSARVINSISTYTEHKAREFSSWLPPIQTVHLALEPPRPSDSSLDLELNTKIAGRDVILIVGRMASNEQYKGHDALIQAMPQILQKLPSVQLVVVGKGDDMARLQHLVNDMELDSNIIFTEFVSGATLDWLYRTCTIYAMPSQHEGFGLVYLEAMRAKKPCIALAGTAPAEIIIDGVTGTLVENSEPNTIANALVHLLSNPEASKKMGEAGYQRWQDYFTYEAFKGRFFSQLDKLVGIN